MDARIQQTRQALFGAFFSMVLTQRYHSIRIGALLKQAGVARSTFYEHFRSKDELLAASLNGPFSILAAAPFPWADHARLTAILQHFHDNRALAPGIFAGPARRIVDRALAELIEAGIRRERAPFLSVSPRMAAQLIAQLQLGALIDWLEGREAMSADRLALTLRQSSAALLASL